MERELNRSDMGAGGSFGGGKHTARTPTRNRPVILVHGITNKASNFEHVRHFFKTHGYTDQEVYGTTYGDGGKTNVVFVTMNCHYMKVVCVLFVFMFMWLQIRGLIQTVADYTSSKVNVIGYSMGSPVARKVGVFGGWSNGGL